MKPLRSLAAAAAAFVAVAAPAQDARPQSLRFASAEEARAHLMADDEWMATVSPFQRSATVGRPDAGVAAFKAALAVAGHACDASEQRRWRDAATAAVPRLRQLAMPTPWPVTIVCTDGSDAGGAPYTRGEAVFMPRGESRGPGADAFVLAHEIVHVTTRAKPELATRLYRELGFEAIEPLAWPEEWLPARISNPDAPHSRHAMRVETPAGQQWLVPLLVASRTQLKPGETFFSVLQVRLLAVEPGRAGQPSLPMRRAGQLLWWPVEAVPAYLQRLGGNTEYVFHPEETLADNIALLASGASAPNPALLDRLRSVLADYARLPFTRKDKP